jgi:hypothetical protein
MVQIGTYKELLASSSTFAQLLEDINQHEQEQQSVSLSNQQSMISSISSEKDDVEEDINSLPKNLETKQEGTVKWNVYISYLRAGFGLIFGFILIIIIFSTQQVLGIYTNWWLAGWSNDESHRHRNLTNCINMRDNKTDEIHRMNDVEWNTYRDRRFYIFCSQFIDEVLLVFI